MQTEALGFVNKPLHLLKLKDSTWWRRWCVLVKIWL